MYLDLLEYCKEQVASTTESPAAAIPLPLESLLETLQTDAEPVATAVPAAASLAAATPVLAGAGVAVELHPASPFGTQQPLPIEGLLPQSSDSDLGLGSDSAAAFVSACGVVAPDAMIIASELYNVFLIWCQETGREPLSQRSFGMRLTGLGFDRKRRGRGRHWWIGLGLAER